MSVEQTGARVTAVCGADRSKSQCCVSVDCGADRSKSHCCVSVDCGAAGARVTAV